jgi:hypothetical protein
MSRSTLPTLTLPGDIPGLLRRGSPVVALIGRAKAATRALVFGHGVDHNGVLVGTSSDGVRWLPDDHLDLDLAGATGRAHAAWWLASNVSGTTAWATWDGCPDGPAGQRHCWWRLRWWALAWPGRNSGHGCEVFLAREVARTVAGGWRVNKGHGCEVSLAREVPSLAGLDPDDPRLLPDGSRWVDAEALRRVCLHVAGRWPGGEG